MVTARIRWIFEKVEGPKVIDIGCSKGIISILLAREGFEVLGVDINEDRIENANNSRNAEPLETRERLKFLCGNIHDFDLPEHTFHTAIIGAFLEHQLSLDKSIARAYELLVIGGKLIMTVPFDLFIRPKHKQILYLASVYKFIYPYFAISEVRIVDKHLCLLCKRRGAVLERQMDNTNLILIERVQQEFQQREVALTKERDKGRRENERLKARQDKLKEQLSAVRDSSSYRLGSIMVQAVLKPGRNTIFLPYRLVSLCLMELRRRKKMATGSPTAKKFPAANVNARPAKQPLGSSLISRKEAPDRILDRCQKIDVTYEDLSKQELNVGEIYLLCVEREGIKYEFFIRPKQSENLLIFGSGAYDSSKLKPPIFQRLSWIHDIGESIIFYNDPTLYLGQLNLGWGQGTPERFYLEEMSDVLEGIIAISGFQKEKAYFYGSSGGGFMALMLAGLLKGTTAIVNNPQTIVTNYYKRHVENLFNVTHPGKSVEEIEEKYANRLNIAEFYKSISYVPEIHYLQNIADKHDIRNHLFPFIEGLYEMGEETVFNRVHLDLYLDEEIGHSPVSKRETIDYINEVISSSQ